ncbi:MAG: hypothetical protein ABSD28_10015 [Tepidisphaeraceae bacterium]|jgi:lysylphosphatidylglycerol synthetase-like protein (DUF2156 family)
MENLWLKIKIWTKITIFLAVVAYLLMFTYNNWDEELTIWVFFGHTFHHVSALAAMLIVLLGGVLGTFLVRMAYHAVRQIRELKQKNATAKMHKDVADIKAKAAMLQTKPQTQSDTSASP